MPGARNGPAFSDPKAPPHPQDLLHLPPGEGRGEGFPWRDFDIGHGRGSFDYTIAEAAIAQGCPPDTISSDVHVFSGNTPGMPYFPWVMSS